MVRAFVAVDLPEDLHEKIAEIQSIFSDFKFKFVNPEIVHITMKFLGDVPDYMIGEISTALDSVQCKPFEAHIKGLGVFPKPRFAKVIWLGCEGNFESLYSLINASLYSFESEKDLHQFSAHATLARIKYLPKKKKADFLQRIEELKDIDLGTFEVSSLKLKMSTLTPQGPVYEDLHEVSLE